MANFFTGSPSSIQTRNRFTPQSQAALTQLLSAGQRNLANPLEGFDAIKTRANQRFNQETVPALLNRFSGSGNNALSSPSLQANLSQAGAGLQERLAGLESMYRNQREALGLQQLGLGLQPQEEAYQLPEDPGFLKGAAGGVGQGLGMAAPFLLNQWLNSGDNKTINPNDTTNMQQTPGSTGGGAWENILATLGGLGGKAAAAGAGLGTVGTLGAGAAGAAAAYGLYRLLSHLMSEKKQIPGQQMSQQQMQRRF